MKIISYCCIVVLLVIFFLIYVSKKKENFVSEEAKEVCKTSQELFDKGNSSYTDFKDKTGKDSVVFMDARKLWKNGELNPKSVQSIIS